MDDAQSFVIDTTGYDSHESRSFENPNIPLNDPSAWDAAFGTLNTDVNIAGS